MGYSEQSFVPGTRYEVAAHGECNVKVVLHSGTNKEEAVNSFKRIAADQARSTCVTRKVELYEITKTLIDEANSENPNASN